MPFVRIHGHQLALVHGSRREGKVVQEVLFTLYSQTEADEATGPGASRFEQLVEQLHPALHFDWPRLRAQIIANRDALPPTYDHAGVRLRDDFRGALISFTRQLLLADPQLLDVAAEVLTEHAPELDYLEKWLAWRRRMAKERKPSQYTADNAFLWRYTSLASEVAHGADEEVIDLYEKRDFATLVPRVKLLVEAFPNYADGFNTLGLVALDQGELDAAIAWFEKTIEVGRAALPKRVRKDAWWNELETRPYMRGLGNLALALNRAGRFEEALVVCDRLAACDEPDTVFARRSTILLNLERYAEAEQSAQRLGVDYVLGLAQLAQGRIDDAREAIVRSLLAHPRVAQRLAGVRVPPAASRQEWEDDDSARHTERDLHAFLAREGGTVKAVLRKLLKNPRITGVLAELRDLEAAERGGHDADRWKRVVFLRSPEFADRVAAELGR